MAKATADGPVPAPREGMPSPQLDEADFAPALPRAVPDPAFERARAPRSSDRRGRPGTATPNAARRPVTRKAGPGFADPDYDLSVDWIAAREAIRRGAGAARRPGRPAAHPADQRLVAQRAHLPGRDVEVLPAGRDRARGARGAGGAEVEVLDLSRLASEYGRNIHPCKACFSTAAPLCHWPCSCYPNYSLGQTQDWMNDIYPMWVEAHGVMIVTPVNWYQVTSPLKLMMDRLVCADGGNPDPTLHPRQGRGRRPRRSSSTAGTIRATSQGRLFSVVVHGDVEGAENVRRSIVRLAALHAAARRPGRTAELDRYIGYWKPYATSHDGARRRHGHPGRGAQRRPDPAEALHARRAGRLPTIGADLTAPREK